MNRRDCLHALAYGPLLASQVRAAEARPLVRLRAAPASVTVAGQEALAVWAYDGVVPGPTLRVRRGEPFELELHNQLPDPTTIHWHGVRVPHAMDGVPYLTQAPIEPGERFLYRFTPPDSGTFWYHPHLGTPEQVERGLAGALVVDDDEPPPVDRDEVWLLDDWRLDRRGRVAEDFYDYMDVSHAGRLGQVLTVNGVPEPTLKLRAGQRLRLRLVNAANARIFALELEGLPAWLIARDGMPADRVERWDGPLLLGPGMRADVIVDATAAGRHALLDRFDKVERRLGMLQVDGATTVVPRDMPRPARAEPLPTPSPSTASVQDLVFGGGMMNMQGWPRDPWTERVARRLRRLGGSRHDAHEPLFSVPRGQTVRLRLDNRTPWWHPIHVHGHHVLLLARNGRPLPSPHWRDTVLLAPRDMLEVAFVADNPGRWLLHCHVLEHHAGGMGAVFEVTA